MGVNQCDKVEKCGKHLLFVFSVCASLCVLRSPMSSTWLHFALPRFYFHVFSWLRASTLARLASPSGQSLVCLDDKLTSTASATNKCVHLCRFARRRILVSKRDSIAVVTPDYPIVPILSCVLLVVTAE